MWGCSADGEQTKVVSWVGVGLGLAMHTEMRDNLIAIDLMTPTPIILEKNLMSKQSCTTLLTIGFARGASTPGVVQLAHQARRATAVSIGRVAAGDVGIVIVVVG